MHKRGQVTVFVILGILIVVILALVFYLYGERLRIQTKEETKFDTSSIEPLKTFVQDCIDKNGIEAISLVGKQGGEVNPGFYQNWNCKKPGDCDKVGYSCFTTEYSSCYNKKPFMKEFVEQELTTYLKNKISECVDLNKIRDAGFNVEAGNLNVNVSILDYNTIVNVNYPITITKGDSVLKQDRFSQTFNAPLGRLIKVAQDIV
ncbi:MAG: transmembrane domain-containing protein, partial [Nanoarchaeota archaeon]